MSALATIGSNHNPKKRSPNCRNNNNSPKRNWKWYFPLQGPYTGFHACFQCTTPGMSAISRRARRPSRPVSPQASMQRPHAQGPWIAAASLWWPRTTRACHSTGIVFTHSPRRRKNAVANREGSCRMWRGFPPVSHGGASSLCQVAS